MIQVAVVIQHHPSRAALIPPLLEQLAPLPVQVVSDPEPDGRPSSWRSYRASLEAFPEEATHALVLQDDTSLCRDFAMALPHVVEAARRFAGSDPLIAVCIGTELSPDSRRSLEAMQLTSRFATIKSWPFGFVPTIATLWPREARDTLLAVARPLPGWRDDDIVIARYLHRLPPLVATLPSLVGHDDLAPSLMELEHKPGTRTPALYIGDEASALELFPAENGEVDRDAVLHVQANILPSVQPLQARSWLVWGPLCPVRDQLGAMMVAFETAVARFRDDPDMGPYDTTKDVGGCWDTAYRFARHLHELGVPYEFRRWHDLPGRRTPMHHNLEVDGRIVDWTYRQRDPSAAWPHIEPVESFRERFGEPLPICPICGSTEQPHTCEGLVRDPWAAALAKLGRAERRRIERLLARMPREQLSELMLEPFRT